MAPATIVAAAAAWGAAALATAAQAPAGAVTPSTDDPTGCERVTVVVDHNALGGADRVDCVAAGTAAEAFDEAGVPLEFLPQQPGYVCRVDGLPESGPCFDGDAYWSLWWSDGSEDWSYATLGVTALEIPDGGSVAFAWHEGAGDATPPDLAVPDAGSSGGAETDAGDGAEDDASFPVWAAGGIAVLVLGAAAVRLLRRMREEAP